MLHVYVVPSALRCASLSKRDSKLPINASSSLEYERAPDTSDDEAIMFVDTFVAVDSSLSSVRLIASDLSSTVHWLKLACPFLYGIKKRDKFWNLVYKILYTQPSIQPKSYKKLYYFTLDSYKSGNRIKIVTHG